MNSHEKRQSPLWAIFAGAPFIILLSPLILLAYALSTLGDLFADILIPKNRPLPAGPGTAMKDDENDPHAFA